MNLKQRKENYLYFILLGGVFAISFLYNEVCYFNGR